ncbi:hypothetical protein [Microbacterium sp. 2FI]|uniref:hypothetical protein n=1 Tax=Microbacterium sp. 2FI TaxID=2502193 RepID=UPI0010FA39B0|nr:hypothetical protein [Microbacterium sp. 2FI]
MDARPLIEPIDRAAVSAFTAELRRDGRVPAAFGGTSAATSVIVVVVVAVVFGSMAVSMLGTIIASFAASTPGGVGFVLLSSFVPLIILGVAFAAIVFAVTRGFSGTRERWYRLDRFARANGMTYLPHLGQPGLPGMIFGLGSARQASDLVRGDRPRFVEFGNYRYTTGSGKNRTTHRWGYVAIKLDVPLPHIVLDANGNNALFGSNLPATFDKDQRLGLEGDFDEYFSLYCPTGYERDALYLFTPDIMARFIDNAAALDVEIVDDWLFLYGKRDFSTLDPATWAWLFSVVGALLDKFAQWARWRDERLRADAAASASAVPFTPPLDALRPPPGVAPPGRRLQKGIPWVSFVVMGAVVLFWLVSQSGVLGLFFR